ncbi:hypothetical protein L5515_001426 [Caenorhabditis briggsae]|uniref:Uncharacterized protein n=1 Tax=Caenorhabditis briggsae TaxID=6238 RepID=A0AAE9E5P9_CAEBR|nr:hypothetical protein L5515_001426 [Caenorhabditis briggsae]
MHWFILQTGVTHIVVIYVVKWENEWILWAGARKKEKDNDGEKPNRKTPEKDQQILKRKIENRAQRKTGRDAARLFQRQIISPLPSLAPFLNFY